jgi:hypothetical protein
MVAEIENNLRNLLMDMDSLANPAPAPRKDSKRFTLFTLTPRTCWQAVELEPHKVEQTWLDLKTLTHGPLGQCSNIAVAVERCSMEPANPEYILGVTSSKTSLIHPAFVCHAQREVTVAWWAQNRLHLHCPLGQLEFESTRVRIHSR